MEEVIISPGRPWQNAYAERVIGSIRRELVDHVIVFSENHLRKLVREYVDHYNSFRTHMSLKGNAPVPRTVEPPERGKVVSLPQVGGLHHLYTRAA